MIARSMRQTAGGSSRQQWMAAREAAFCLLICIENRSKINRVKMPLRAISTRTRCYVFNSYFMMNGHKKRALKARFCKAGGGRQKLSSTAPLLALEALKANLASTPRV